MARCLRFRLGDDEGGDGAGGEAVVGEGAEVGADLNQVAGAGGEDAEGPALAVAVGQGEGGVDPVAVPLDVLGQRAGVGSRRSETPAVRLASRARRLLLLRDVGMWSVV